MRTSLKIVFLLTALMMGLTATPLHRLGAQTVTTLHSFTATSGPYPGTNSDGAAPIAAMILSDETLYGTATTGGNSGHGTVFAVNVDGTEFRILHSFTTPTFPYFTNSDGGYPTAGLVLLGNRLFGTASGGGSSGYGTVFALNTDGTGFKNLYSFSAASGPYPGTNNDGASPDAGLVLSGNTLYGTAAIGGTSGNGTVFALNTDGTGFTNLHSFTATASLYAPNSDGAGPAAALVLSGNTLYGTARRGGSSAIGTVFAVNTDGTGFTNLHDFSLIDGEEPDAGLIISGNTLYGTTRYGGIAFPYSGTVFSLKADGSDFAVLHSFTGASDGVEPRAGLVLSGNRLYGTASAGGSSDSGTVFTLNSDGTGFTNLYNFPAGTGFPSTNSGGLSPYAGLVLSGGRLYGTARLGGVAGSGTVFGLSLSPPPFTTLHSFNCTPNDGRNPQAGVIVSGNRLYGAADSGGTSGVGTIFALATDGTDYSTLYSLIAPFDFDSTNTDGAYPDVAGILSGDTLYGAAYWGGAHGNGTVFKVSTNGTGFTTLHDFSAGIGSFPFNYTNSDGAGLGGGMVLSGTTLFGAAEHGGASGYGAVYRMNLDGSGFTNLHSFTDGSDGSIPEGLLISGDTLYGTTLGFSGNGTVYRMNTDGSDFTVLHTFTATNWTPILNGGPGPAPLSTNSDGVLPTSLTLSVTTLYGTAYAGGSWGNGLVFALNTDGSGFVNLHSFAASQTNSAGVYTNHEGAHPLAFSGVVLRGNTLYGTAGYGGRSGNGTLFALNTDGSGFTNLHTFSGTDPVTGANSDGANPYAGMALSGDFLFGTTRSGGCSGDGTVFRYQLPTTPPHLTIFHYGANVVLTWPTNSVGFVLQSIADLAVSANWDTVSPDPVVVNGQNVVTNEVTSSRNFYRLSR